MFNSPPINVVYLGLPDVLLACPSFDEQQTREKHSEHSGNRKESSLDAAEKNK